MLFLISKFKIKTNDFIFVTVCKLWKRAASKQWKKIREINYLNEELNEILKPGDEVNAELIPTEDATKIAYFAAPFVRILKGTRFFIEYNKLVMFGPFLYKVMGFNDDVIVNLLAKNATGLTEFHFDKEPIPLIGKLFETNKIKKVMVTDSDDFYRFIKSDDVEDLTLHFADSNQIESFEGVKMEKKLQFI